MSRTAANRCYFVVNVEDQNLTENDSELLHTYRLPRMFSVRLQTYTSVILLPPCRLPQSTDNAINCQKWVNVGEGGPLRNSE